jgi:hypothetical protein
VTVVAAAEPAPLLLILTGCHVCGDCRKDVGLYATMSDGTRVCSECWKDRGSPWPQRGTMAEFHEAEVATVARMQKRGGTDRHLVRNGMS